MKKLKPSATGLFIASFFMLGAYSIATQIILIREFLVILFGNELCIGTIFAVWLASIFAGALAGGRLVARVPYPLTIYLSFIYSLIALPFLQAFLIRNVRAIFTILPGETIAFGAAALAICVVLFPFAFAVGLIFPCAARSYPQATTHPSYSIGAVYVWESLGSMVGAAVLTYWLIGRFSHFQIMGYASGVLVVICCFLASQIPLRLSRQFFYFFGAAMVATWVVITGLHGWEQIEAQTTRQRWHTINPQIALVENLDSRYQNLAVGKIEDQYSIYGNGQHISSFPDPLESAITAHFLLTQHPNPQAVLLIGGGMEGVLGEMLKHPIKELHYVELDPALITVAQRHLPLEAKLALDDPRVKTFTCDGRFFVKNAPSAYDVVIINTPDPSTAMLNRFYTVDFYKEIKSILKPEGLLVAKISSAENYIGPEVERYVGSVYHSLSRVFSHVLVTPGDYNYFFASNAPGVATVNSAELSERYKSRGITCAYFSPHFFPMLLAPERVDYINQAIRRSAPPYPNTDNRPVSYFYNLVLWDLFSRQSKQTIFEHLSDISGTWYLLSVPLLLATGCFYLWRSRNRGHYQRLRFVGLYAIVSTGFAAMGLELVLLFSFQNLYGYLYHHIGIMVASFMAGLAAGATIINRASKHSLRWRVATLLVLELAVAAFSLLVPCLLDAVSQLRGHGSSLAETQWLAFVNSLPFLLMLFGLGLLTGLEFPLVSSILTAAGGKPGRVAGLVDGFDHGGASLGAALTGTLFVPLYGLSYSASLIAGLNAASLVFLSIVLLGVKKGQEN